MILSKLCYLCRKDVYKLIYNSAITLMMNNGYQVMGSNVPCLALLFQHDEVNEQMNIVGLMNNVGKSELTSEQLDSITFQIERKFLIGRYAREVNIIYLVFSDDFERDKKYSQGKSAFWLMDVLCKRIVVFEDQPDDFFGLKSLVKNVFDEQRGNSAAIFSSTENRTDRQKRKKKFPIITVLLLFINIIVFIWLEMNGDTENPVYMLKNGAALGRNIFDKHEYYRLLTAVFMHFGIGHLLNNMLALWILGSKLESIIGSIRFVILYILSGLAGSLVSAVHYYNSVPPVVSAGASGAIYGILGAILVVALIQRRRNDKSMFIRMGLVLFLMFYGGGRQGVDMVAHMGGLAGGIAIMLIFKFFSDKQTFDKLKNLR